MFQNSIKRKLENRLFFQKTIIILVILVNCSFSIKCAKVNITFAEIRFLSYDASFNRCNFEAIEIDLLIQNNLDSAVYVTVPKRNGFCLKDSDNPNAFIVRNAIKYPLILLDYTSSVLIRPKESIKIRFLLKETMVGCLKEMKRNYAFLLKSEFDFFCEKIIFSALNDREITLSEIDVKKKFMKKSFYLNDKFVDENDQKMEAGCLIKN